MTTTSLDTSAHAKKLEGLLSDIDRQPHWRDEAARCADYYDGKQLEPDVIETMKERGQPVLVNNLIGPTIDGVLGMEAKTRQGFIVRADTDKSSEVAEALNQEINEMGRMTKVDRARSDAFAGQVKAGLGWVEVNFNGDPFEYDYCTDSIHRDEIWWDWHSKKPDLTDARWLLRRRWVDEDECEAYFPKHKELIRHAANGWANFMSDLEMQARPVLFSAYQDYSSYNWREEDLFDCERGRVRVHEVYFRRFERGYVMTLPDGRKLRFDKKNTMHRALVESGQVQLQNMPYKRMYLAWYIGPHMVAWGPSPHPHDHFPYVPFWGMREDSTGIPYVLVRRMLSPQDEVNFRRSKLTWLLNSKRIVMDDDATDMSDQDLISELNRPDGVIKLNKDRKNVEHKGFFVEQDTALSNQQFQIMQEAMKQIQDCAGIYSAVLGQDSNATSGVAINGLVEQGATTMAELFDNYRFGSQQVGELMLAYKIQEIGRTERRVMVNVNTPDPTKEIVLNGREVGEGGETLISNDVMRTKSMVILDDMMNTPGYRAQIAQRMMELVQTLPPNLQASVLDLVIMNTDVPKKEEFLKRIRRATGVGVNPEELTEDERKQFEQQQKKQAMMDQLQMREVQGKIADIEADVRRKLAAAAKDEKSVEGQDVDNDYTEAQTLKVLAELKEMTQRIGASAYVQSGYMMPEPTTPPQLTM